MGKMNEFPCVPFAEGFHRKSIFRRLQRLACTLYPCYPHDTCNFAGLSHGSSQGSGDLGFSQRGDLHRVGADRIVTRKKVEHWTLMVVNCD